MARSSVISCSRQSKGRNVKTASAPPANDSSFCRINPDRCNDPSGHPQQPICAHPAFAAAYATHTSETQSRSTGPAAPCDENKAARAIDIAMPALKARDHDSSRLRRSVGESRACTSAGSPPSRIGSETPTSATQSSAASKPACSEAANQSAAPTPKAAARHQGRAVRFESLDIPFTATRSPVQRLMQAGPREARPHPTERAPRRPRAERTQRSLSRSGRCRRC